MKLNKKQTRSAVAALSISAALMTACGGGGGGGAASSTLGEGVALAGTVATGRAYPEGTQITVTDADGQTVGTGAVTGSEGAYSLTLTTASPKLPLIITATSDDEETMVGLATSVGATATANVTPITHLIASTLSPTGDPLDLAKGQTSLVTDANVTSAVSAAVANIASVTGATEAGSSNPLTTPFKADGTKQDSTLENVKISIRPQGDGTAQVQIYTPAATNSAASGGSDNPVTFSTSKGAVTSLATVGKLPAVTNLTDNGAIVQVQALMKRMTDCYGLPKESRSTSGALSTACKGIFWNNDPSTYKSNSYTVSSATSGKASAWQSMFNNASTTKVAYEQPKILFISKQTIDGAEVKLPVVQVKWTASFPCSTGSTEVCQNTAIDKYVLRADSTGKLYQWGNQSSYDISIDPRVELRDFPNYKDSNGNAYSYYNAGYNMYVEAASAIGRVVVTTPSKKAITLKPIPGGGYSYLGVVKGNPSTATAVCTNSKHVDCISTTSVMRFAATYDNAAVTSSSGADMWASTNHPRDIDRTLAWTANFDASGTATGWKNWTDTELASIPEQGLWTFDIYDTSDAKVATETRRTSSRIPTMAQAKNMVWPRLSDGLRAMLISKSSATGGFTVSIQQPLYITADMTSTGGAGWVVPTGAWAPLSVKIYGNYYYDQANNPNNKRGFDDRADVRSSHRKTTIYCSGEQCASSSTSYRPYSVGATTNYDGFGQLQLNGQDVYRVQTWRIQGRSATRFNEAWNTS
ncbi:hypothetical protein [Limnohabitans sp.]|uniref:hypothetical protein n=1 Tax=Limnohabitans sp. TaxID=1907725 RepID=UPI00286FAC90|nr:hypothetical protein [Limnohabitans sp.]